MANIHICEEDELTLADCECDDCLSQKLDAIKEVLDKYYEYLDTELLSQLDDIKNNFGNYYNKAQVDEQMNEATGMSFQEVAELPNEPYPNIIYLLPVENGDGNCRYTKWFFFNGKWESFVCGDDIAITINFEYKAEGTEIDMAFKKTYVNSGQFPEQPYDLPDEYTFNGWVCGENIYQPEEDIPEEWFTGEVPCKVITADITTPRTLVLIANVEDTELTEVDAEVTINEESETVTLNEDNNFETAIPLNDEDTVSVTWREYDGYMLIENVDGDTYTAIYTIEEEEGE